MRAVRHLIRLLFNPESVLIAGALCQLILIAPICLADTMQARLAFVANVDGNWDLFTVNEDGRNLVRLTSTPFDEKTPSWSSDRKKIVYSASDGEVHIIDTTTKEQQQINTDDHSRKFSPALSPNGKKITFVQFRQGNRDHTDLMLFDLETGKTRKVLDQFGPQSWPAWSPDGTHIVYTTAQCSADCGRLIQELWMADSGGGFARQLVLTNAFCQQPVWSPDGMKIAFSSDMSGSYNIWILSLTDWKLERVTTGESLDVSPTWSPDGTKIAFVSTRSGHHEIWIKDLKNGNLQKVNAFGDRAVECRDVSW